MMELAADEAQNHMVLAKPAVQDSELQQHTAVEAQNQTDLPQTSMQESELLQQQLLFLLQRPAADLGQLSLAKKLRPAFEVTALQERQMVPQEAEQRLQNSDAIPQPPLGPETEDASLRQNFEDKEEAGLASGAVRLRRKPDEESGKQERRTANIAVVKSLKDGFIL